MDDETGAPTAGPQRTAVDAAAPAVRSAGSAGPVRPSLQDAPPYAQAETFRFSAPPRRAGTEARDAVGADAPVAALWTATALVVVVLTAFFALVVSGRVVTEGPVVLRLTSTHGVHLGDLAALALWGAAVGVQAWALAAAVRSRRRTTSGRATARR